MDTVTTLLLSTSLRGWFDGGFGGRGDWHMMDWGRGFFFPGGFFVLLTGLALLLLLVWAIRSWSNRPTPATVGTGDGVRGYTANTPVSQPIPPADLSSAGTPSVNTPLHALQMRYAKGEVSRAEYETIRQDLLADMTTGASSTAALAIQPEGVETPVASNETAVADTTDTVSSEPTAAESTSEQEKRADV